MNGIGPLIGGFFSNKYIVKFLGDFCQFEKEITDTPHRQETLNVRFLILYYEYDCNTICHKNLIMIHSLLYRLSYHEAIVLITLSYHKAIILLLLHDQCVNHSLYLQIIINFFHIIFSFLRSSVNIIMYIISTVFCITSAYDACILMIWCISYHQYFVQYWCRY